MTSCSTPRGGPSKFRRHHHPHQPRLRIIPARPVVEDRDAKPAPPTWAQTFWISVGPLVVNSFACIVLAFLYAQAQPDSFLAYLLGWIAISVGMHAFPSDHDAANVLVHSKQSLTDGGSFFHYLTYPFFWIIWLANKLRVFWFDFIYAMALFYVGSSL